MGNQQLNPIAFFVYNRPKHTLKTLESLRRNHGIENTLIYVFCDGPKGSSKKEIKQVEETRKLVKNIDWCLDTIVYEEEKNKGVTRALTEGVSKVLEAEDSVVVVEDDLDLSPYFLQYMKDSLSTYRSVPEVMAVAGYMWPHKFTNLPETFFLKFSHYWGWGTWKRAWKYYPKDTNALVKRFNSSEIIENFNRYSIFSYSSFDVLHAANDKLLENWDIFWSATVFLQDGLVLYPRKSLVRNIGFDNTGVNCLRNKSYNFHRQAVNTSPVSVKMLPLKENTRIRDLLSRIRDRLYPARMEYKKSADIVRRLKLGKNR